MSHEADVFIASDFISAHRTMEFALFGGGTVDDHEFWAVSAVPSGVSPQDSEPINAEVEITRTRIATVNVNNVETKTLFFTVRNNSSSDVMFTRGAIRLPPSS